MSHLEMRNVNFHFSCANQMVSGRSTGFLLGVFQKRCDDQSVSTSVSAYDSVKVALHSSVGAPLIGREKEISFLHDFISENLRKKNSASIYVSGPPGTGKTASINHILENFKVRDLI